MVWQNFTMNYILTGNEETLSEKESSRPHIPCVPQPQPPGRYSDIAIQPKRNEDSTTSQATMSNLSGGQSSCPEYAASSLSMLQTHWRSADGAAPSLSETEQACYHQDTNQEDTSPKSERRLRTSFTSLQVCKLEDLFNKKRYVGGIERKKIASALDLTENQVKTWFQNRRMKLKKQIQDHQHQLTMPAVHYSYPPHPYYHGPPIPVNNLPFYQTHPHLHELQQPTYSTDPLFLIPPVPLQAAMSNAHPEQYSDFLKFHHT